MPKPDPQHRRTRRSIARQLAGIDAALPGNITTRMMSCGKPNCRCADDDSQRHGPYIQWTRTVEGKTVTKMLSAEQLDRYQPWFDNARQLRELAAELQMLSIDALKQAEGWGT